MMDIDQFETVLDAIANTLPPAFYEELNGGILLLPEAKRHPKARGDDLYIMGSITAIRPWGVISSFITAPLSGYTAI